MKEDRLLSILLNGMLEASTAGLPITEEKLRASLLPYPPSEFNNSQSTDHWNPQQLQGYDSMVKMIEQQIHFKRDLEAIHKSCADFCRLSLNNNEKTISEVLSVIPNTQIPSNNGDLKNDKNRSKNSSNFNLYNNNNNTPLVNYNNYLNNNGIINSSNLLNYPHQNANSISPIHNTRTLSSSLNDQNNNPNHDPSLFQYRPLNLGVPVSPRNLPAISDTKNQGFFIYNSPIKSYHNAISPTPPMPPTSIYPPSSNYYHKLTSERSSPKRENVIKKTRKKGSTFPKEAIAILKNWLQDNIDNPYPCEKSKQILAAETGLNKPQIANWFINARRRYLKNRKDDENGRSRKQYNQKIKYEKANNRSNSNDFLNDNLIVEDVLDSSENELKKSLDFSNGSSSSSPSPTSPSMLNIPPPDLSDKNNITMDDDTKEITSLPPSLVFSLAQKNLI